MWYTQTHRKVEYVCMRKITSVLTELVQQGETAATKPAGLGLMDLTWRLKGRGSNRTWADGINPEPCDWLFLIGAADSMIQD